MPLPILRPYQVEIGRAIFESVVRRRGLTFTVEIARQGGKNEVSAQLEVLLLTLFMERGGTAIKASPTFKPQALISMRRLQDRLGDAGFGGFWRREHGYMLRLGQARAIFLSAEEGANVVGQTASLLLEIDEAQDVVKEKFSKDFRPMGAAHNVTTVLYGTAWDEATLLEEQKQLNLEQERKDGVRRHFRYDWESVAEHNPDYRRFVEGERERLGAEHPLFLTQYCLRSLRGGGNLLSPQQQAQLQGDHPRRHSPEPGATYVAGLDLAGGLPSDSENPASSAILSLSKDGASRQTQDATVLTIAELDFSVTDFAGKPRLKVAEHYRWQNVAHSELFPQLVDLLGNHWRCRRVVVDATGLGQTLAELLGTKLGRRTVVPFAFTAQSKSRLGFELLASINAGRLKVYAGDGSEEHQEFWTQMSQAEAHFRPNQTMSFFVPQRLGHDDFVMSLALAVEAGDYRPRLAKGS